MIDTRIAAALGEYDRRIAALEAAPSPVPSPVPAKPALVQGGGYIYGGLVASQTTKQAALGRLAQHGLPLAHVALGSDLREWLDAAESCGMRIVAQLDGAYLVDPTKAAVAAAQAIAYTQPVASHSALAGISIREEPPATLMPSLDSAYGAIRAALPGVPIVLTHNQLSAAQVTISNRPDLLWTDRYAFWGWDPSAGGYCATPRSALAWLWGSCRQFAATATGSEFGVVLSASRMRQAIDAAQVGSGRYGDSARIRSLAAAGNQGWSVLSDGRFLMTKYYEPPPGATRAMVRIAALAGARRILMWTCWPDAASSADLWSTQQWDRAGSGEIISAVSEERMAEFAAAVDEINTAQDLFVSGSSVERQAEVDRLVADFTGYPSSLVGHNDLFIIGPDGRLQE